MDPEIVYGDILHQNVEVIVNSWNRNIIPWWLLLPQGVSGAIKKHGGLMPFKEIGRVRPMPLGSAKEISAGTLQYKSIIHVAGINMFWFATEFSVSKSVYSAMAIVNEQKYQSVAFPLIGSGSGNRGQEWSLSVMLMAFRSIESDAKVKIIRYSRGS
ncbi:MAG: macro domain-containing protein [Candidatus Thiothrix singaporensis]|uniref:Macro domain-containing protein n=1 Tax=Candidatus Thiothrix singaporensis TaxID=2799669 RepID=A0A7L6AY88_9GAMM|nr:MAG: macro domain-containing protein [Candidatus Thiothrix singaporensis]